METKIWNDEKFKIVPPMLQRLFLYFLTCPHANFLGIFVLKPAYVLGDLRYKKERDYMKELDGLSQFTKYDPETEVIWIINSLKYNTNNKKLNEKQRKGAEKILKDLPNTPLILEFIEYYDSLLGKVSIDLQIPLSEDNNYPYGITDSETERDDTPIAKYSETDSEKKDMRDSDKSLVSLAKWFEDVMWPSVPTQKKRGKEPTWKEIQKLKPDESTREKIVKYFEIYYEVKSTYDGVKDEFMPDMQDPVRVIKHKRYEDELVPCGAKPNGKGGPEKVYYDKAAYEEAKSRGENCIYEPQDQSGVEIF